MYGLSAPHQGRNILSHYRRSSYLFSIQDRSLGTVELRVSDLATESDDTTYPFQSTGRKDIMDPLRLDKDGTLKGHLHYTAEFVPSMKLKGIKFAGHSNEMQQAAEQESDAEGGNATDGESSISSSDDDAQAVPIGVTIGGPKKHRRGAKSTDTTATTTSKNTAVSDESKLETPRSPSSLKSPVEEGVELTHEELFTHRTLPAVS